MSRQGYGFTEEQRRRIILLLSSSDLSISEIAIRMDCSRNAIASINRKFRIRAYSGRKRAWQKFDEMEEPLTQKKS